MAEPATTTEVTPTRESEVTLEPITRDTLISVLRLKVAEHQTSYVATTAVSVAQASFDGRAWQRSIHADGVPVGYVLVDLGGGDDPRPYLWRYMIDARYQGLGFGSRALTLIMQRVLELEGPGRFSTSTVPGEHSPQAFYERLGFAATGEIEDGEVVLARQLVAAEPRSAPGPDTGAPAPGSDFYCERVLSGDVHVRIVERSGDVLAFHHTRPRWPVHIVVIPTRHVPSLTDLGPSTDGPPEQLLADLLAAVRRVAAQVEREHGAARVITNLGSYQDSKHLHWHICSGKPIGDDGL